MPIRVQYIQRGVTEAQYHALRDAIGWDRDQPPGGLVHTVAFRDGAIDIVDLWESREQFEAFEAGRFIPATKTVGLEVSRPELVELLGIAAARNISRYIVGA